MFKRAGLVILLAASAFAAAVMHNGDVVRMVHHGESVADIVGRIDAAAPGFRMYPEDIAALRKNGVPDAVIAAMNARIAGDTAPGVMPAESRAAAAKPRIFVDDTPNSVFARTSHPQRVEIMKTFGQSCPAYVVTDSREKADFVLSFERESGKWVRRDNKLAVFNHNGDMVYSASTRELGSAVRGFCQKTQ